MRLVSVWIIAWIVLHEGLLFDELRREEDNCCEIEPEGVCEFLKYLILQ